MDIPQFDVHAALEEKHWWFTSRRSLLEKILEKIVPKNGNIVDVGCGTGANTAAFAAHYSCIGIDPIPEAIHSAQVRFPGVTYRTGFAPKDCPEIHTADAVLLLDVLEHIEDDFFFVSELLSAMKPEAYLIMMAPADIHLWSTHDRGFDHFRRYSAERFRMLWKDLPVKEVLVTHWNTRLYWPIRIIRQITRMIGISIGSADTDLRLPSKPLNALLHALVSSEDTRILKALEGKSLGFSHGVSIMGIIQKTTESVVPQKRPDTLPADITPWK
ncbi:hypothetical protein COU75_03825 [Candidatus Peregrinibacteria bacterium CG10_big_fil_rev_8_21_14_0_10_42_8]|nr:MAG: hypothetical protein COU75_03825 [Candidatus Peregrinibacteria bacterium CG10_big_fil_rev_8_21_14_0_10_42_8]